MTAVSRIVVVRAWVDSGIVKARLVSSDGLSATAGSLQQTLGVLTEWLGDLGPSGSSRAHKADLAGDDPVTDE